MNALVIWGLLPALAAVALYLLRRYEKGIHLAGILVCIGLAYLAWRLPIDEPISLRILTALPAIRIVPLAVILGGGFRLDNATRPALALLYLSAAFWFGGAYPARTHRLFVPLGLAIIALISITLAAEQTPTAALLIELAVLLCVPLVSSPGEKIRRGVMRFLTYQTGGVCLILLSEAGIAASAAAGETQQSITILFTLLLGFGMLLAVVPFHTWMPMMLESGNPYSAIFVCFVIPATVAVLVVELLFQVAATGMTPVIIAVLRYGGVLMVVAGGIGAALERHLGRVAGFAALLQVGMTLLAVSLNDQVGRVTPQAGIFFAQLIPQGIGLAIWGLSLSILRFNVDTLRFYDARGAGRRLPFTTGALIIANLSTAGLPLLASFPVYVALWAQLGARSLPSALFSLAGNIGLLVAGLRSLAVLIAPTETEAELASIASPDVSVPSAARIAAWQISETRLQMLLLCVGAGLIVLAGLFPQAYFPTLTNMAIQFTTR